MATIDVIKTGPDTMAICKSWESEHHIITCSCADDPTIFDFIVVNVTSVLRLPWRRSLRKQLPTRNPKILAYGHTGRAVLSFRPAYWKLATSVTVK